MPSSLSLLHLRGPIGKRIPSFTLVFTLAFASAPKAVAQVPREERPLQEVFRTDLVYTQDRGEIQLTTGMRSRWNQGLLEQWPVQAEYGMTDRLQLQVEWAGWQELRPLGQPSANGPGDVAIGAKYSFMNIRGSAYHAALSFEVVLPSGNTNKDLGDGFLCYTPSLLLARDLSKHRRMQLFTQIGVAFAQRVRHHENFADDAPAAHELEWSGGLFVPLRHAVIVTEVSWQTNTWNHNGQINEIDLTPGIVWKLPWRWECGAGASFGLTPASDRVGLQIKFTKEFHSYETQARMESGWQE
jgi:hypothetical protein